MCRVLEVSRSGYYAWLKRLPSQRAQEDEQLTNRIRTIYTRSKGTYGAARIHAELISVGVRVGQKRVARLMKAAHLPGVSRRKYYRTTQRAQKVPPASDLVQPDFRADGPNQFWLADITFIATWVGRLYRAVVLDVWSRRVVGWAMATHLRSQLVLDALQMAISQRHPEDVIHHSDQGSQYTSLAFGNHCQ